MNRQPTNLDRFLYRNVNHRKAFQSPIQNSQWVENMQYIFTARLKKTYFFVFKSLDLVRVKSFKIRERQYLNFFISIAQKYYFFDLIRTVKLILINKKIVFFYFSISEEIKRRRNMNTHPNYYET